MGIGQIRWSVFKEGERLHQFTSELGASCRARAQPEPLSLAPGSYTLRVELGHVAATEILFATWGHGHPVTKLEPPPNSLDDDASATGNSNGEDEKQQAP